MKVRILGCGPSPGIPMIGHRWGVCDPAEPRNRRSRPSILFERRGKTILVDAGPDIRMQMLAADIHRLDAVILTHEHADHTLGIDDLKAFGLLGNPSLDVYGSRETMESVLERFGYMFKPRHQGTAPFLVSHILNPGDALPAFAIRTFAQQHSRWITLGIRCGGAAYSTDLTGFGEEGFATLEGVAAWVVAAQSREASIAHAGLSTVLEWIARIRPRSAWLTHMNSSMDYRTLLKELPDGVEPAYDGLVIEIDD